MKEETIDGIKYSIKEVKYKELTSMSDLSSGEQAKKLMMLSVGMTEEEYNELGLKTGIKLQQIINDVNGLTNFQSPPI